MERFKLVKGEGDYVFVNGTTKYLRNADQNDLGTLYKNGDKRVKKERKPTEKPEKVKAKI